MPRARLLVCIELLSLAVHAAALVEHSLGLLSLTLAVVVTVARLGGDAEK